MTTQMILRIDDQLKNKVDRLARAEGKNTSVLVRELLAEYVVEHDPSTYIDSLWTRIGAQLKKRRVSSGDVEKAIRQVRAERS